MANGLTNGSSTESTSQVDHHTTHHVKKLKMRVDALCDRSISDRASPADHVPFMPRTGPACRRQLLQQDQHT